MTVFERNVGDGKIASRSILPTVSIDPDCMHQHTVGKINLEIILSLTAL